MVKYADYCPIAVGVDVLADRWTPLVIREMSVGSERFNDIHRGIPRISRSLLAQRLRAMERHGLVQSEPGEPGRPGRYTLTPPGQGLTPIVWAIGQWAAEWTFGDPTDEECNGLGLMWRMHQLAIPPNLPSRRTVVHMVLTGPGAAEGWLEVENGALTVCKDDPGLDVDLAVDGNARQLQRWLVGLVPFRRLVADGAVRVLGPSRLARAFPSWFNTTLWDEGMARARRHRGELPA